MLVKGFRALLGTVLDIVFGLLLGSQGSVLEPSLRGLWCRDEGLVWFGLGFRVLALTCTTLI